MQGKRDKNPRIYFRTYFKDENHKDLFEDTVALARSYILQEDSAAFYTSHLIQN